MTENPNDPGANGNIEDAAPVPPPPDGPTVPKPHDRPTDIDRRIRGAVEKMLEDVLNPYEAVIVASQEARRINERRLKARSILNQSMEHVEELVPEVPFIPHPVQDDEPEVKATSEAMEKLACGLIDYEVEGQEKTGPSYYGQELDFPLFPEEDEGESTSQE